MRETDEMQGRPMKKKGQFGNEKHCICTTNYLRAVLTMRVDKLIVADALFLVLAQLILASASTFALSLTVKIIVPSFVSQAILSNFSGRLFLPLVFRFRCHHHARVFRKFWATNASLLAVGKCLTAGKGTMCTGVNDDTKGLPVRISETAAS